MLYNLFDGSTVNIGIAYVAGLITFFASCLLPLVPTYLAYLSGIGFSEAHQQRHRSQITRAALSFVTGFVTTFVLLGVLLNQFAALVTRYEPLIEKVAGFFFIMLGLFVLGIFKSTRLSTEHRFHPTKLFKKHLLVHAFIFGVAFGFGWSPCIGPVLAVILFWSAQQDTFWKGLSLLITYGIGLGTPFLLTAMAFEKVVPLLERSKKITRVLTILSGLVIIVAGLLLFFGEFERLSFYLLQLFNLDALSV